MPPGIQDPAACRVLHAEAVTVPQAPPPPIFLPGLASLGTLSYESSAALAALLFNVVAFSLAAVGLWKCVRVEAGGLGGGGGGAEGPLHPCAVSTATRLRRCSGRAQGSRADRPSPLELDLMFFFHATPAMTG